MPAHPIEILLIEDNAADIRLSQEALDDGEVISHLSVARDGAGALAFLRQEGEHEEAERPELILLDLDLPDMPGRDVLKAIKEDPGLRRIPVLVMTTSEDEAEILDAYDLNANCFIAKPRDLDKFIDVVKAIERFWLTLVRLPQS